MIKVDEKHPATIALRKAETMLQSLGEKRHEKDLELQEKTAQFMRQAALGSRSAIDLEAGELLLAEGGAAVKTPVGASDIQRLEHELNVLTTAVEKQQRIVDHERAEFSVIVCDSQRNAYIQIERDILAALEKLAQANQAERDFFNALKDAGVSSIPFRFMRVREVGLASDPQGKLSRHRQELAQFAPEVLETDKKGNLWSV
jgi:hypothetical protein